jgi:hypothetical protein
MDGESNGENVGENLKHSGLGKGDIGVFVADNEAVLNRNMPILPAVNCPGTEWLIRGDPPSFLPCDDISAIVHACGGNNSARTTISLCGLRNLAAVSPTACQTLRRLIEHAFPEAISTGCFIPQLPIGQRDGALNSSQVQVANGSCEMDFKVLVSPAQLFDITGEASYDAILQALGCSVPDAIVKQPVVLLRSTQITPPVPCKYH